MRIGATATVALVTLAACSGGGDETATTATSVDREERMLAFARCMRDNGIDYPDPAADGTIDVEVDPGDEPAWRGAEEACGDLRPASAPMPETQRVELADQLVAQAGCMREHGWDVPDPEVTTDGDGGVQFLYPRRLDIDMEDPEYQADHRACVEETGLDEGQLGSGGGFGG